MKTPGNEVQRIPVVLVTLFCLLGTNPRGLLKHAFGCQRRQGRRR